MKVIVTGATGLVGQGIVKNCLADSRITKVVILTRKAVSMDIESHPKAEVIMHQDYARYSDELLSRLAGASACLWAIGGSVDQFQDNKQLLHQVMVDFPLAAAKTMCERLSSHAPSSTKFSFVFCSNKNAIERHGPKALAFLGDARKQRGEAEKGLCDIADAHADTFKVYILRPNGLVPKDTPQKKKRLGGLSSSSPGVEAALLARVAVKVACEGWKDRVLDNDALLKL